MSTKRFLNLLVLQIVGISALVGGTLGCTETVQSKWDGVCNSDNQPGAAVTLVLNTGITSLSSPLFSGSCGALGSPCELSVGVQSAESAFFNDFGFIAFTLWNNPNCSSLNSAGNLLSALSTDTLGNALETLGFACMSGESIQIGPIKTNLSNIPLAVLANTSSTRTSNELFSCALPGHALLPTSICVPCP